MSPPPDPCCDGQTHVYSLTRIQAPTDGGGHTVFYLLACACGRADVFPPLNYTLTTAAFRVQFRARLAVDDLVLVALAEGSVWPC